MVVIKIFNFFLIIVLIILTLRLLKVEQYQSNNDIEEVKEGIIEKIKNDDEYLKSELPNTLTFNDDNINYDELDSNYSNFIHDYQTTLLDKSNDLFKNNNNNLTLFNLLDIDNNLFQSKKLSRIDQDNLSNYSIVNEQFPYIKFNFDSLNKIDSSNSESFKINLKLNNKYIKFSEQILSFSENTPTLFVCEEKVDENNKTYYNIKLDSSAKYLFIRYENDQYLLDLLNNVNTLQKYYVIEN